MRVFIANFGRHNYEWPECLRRGTIATMNDERVQGFWAAGERDAYINYCIANLLTTAGIAPTRSVASRWFNLMSIIAESNGDIWIHREKEQFWWTTSNDQSPTFETASDPDNGKPVVVCHKPCAPWQSTNSLGNRLMWNGLHPRAKEFLFTEGTLQQLSKDNAEYAICLLRGENLQPWHEQPSWKSKAASSKKAATGSVFNPRQLTIARMVMTAMRTVEVSNGQEVLRTVKEKKCGFGNTLEFERYVEDLLKSQEGLCALTEMKLQLDKELDDPEMACSLDRIDSDGDYERGNLQIVCKFANRWKSASNNDEFIRLICAIRRQPSVAEAAS